jgi:hypothetical protein
MAVFLNKAHPFKYHAWLLSCSNGGVEQLSQTIWLVEQKTLTVWDLPEKVC